jgi:hypothetical protein
VVAVVMIYWWNGGAFYEVVALDRAPAMIAQLRDQGYYVWSKPVSVAA